VGQDEGIRRNEVEGVEGQRVEGEKMDLEG
jgi:hypothetical protein